MEWQKGVAWLTEKWIGFKEAFMAVATEAVYGTAKILTSAWAGLQTAWVETVALLCRRPGRMFTSRWSAAGDATQNWLAKRIAELWGLFDSSIDVEAVQKGLDEDYQREKQSRQRATQDQLQSIEANRQAKRAAIDQEEKDVLQGLDREKMLGTPHVRSSTTKISRRPRMPSIRPVKNGRIRWTRRHASDRKRPIPAPAQPRGPRILTSKAWISKGWARGR